VEVFWVEMPWSVMVG